MKLQRRHRALPKEKEHARPPHQAIGPTKGELLQTEVPAAQPTQDRRPKPSVNPGDLINLKTKPAHTSRVPSLNSLVPTNPAQPEKRLEHITKNRPNAKRAVLPSNRNNNNIVKISSARPHLKLPGCFVSGVFRISQPGSGSLSRLYQPEDI
jgi:hypothetical protein